MLYQLDIVQSFLRNWTYRVAINIFRDRVNNDVSAMIQGILYIGTEKGVVNHNHYAMLMCNCCNCPYIDEAKGWIAGTLDPYQLRLVRPYELCNIQFNAGREGDLDTVRCGYFGEVSVCPAIDVRD